MSGRRPNCCLFAFRLTSWIHCPIWSVFIHRSRKLITAVEGHYRYLPRGLPGSFGFLSTNGSHLHEDRVDVPTTWGQDVLDGLQGAQHHAVAHPYQTPAPHGLDHLRVE